MPAIPIMRISARVKMLDRPVISAMVQNIEDRKQMIDMMSISWVMVG